MGEESRRGERGSELMLQRLRNGTLAWLTGEREKGDSKEGVKHSNLGRFAELFAAKS